jgi:hypothetical protein
MTNWTTLMTLPMIPDKHIITPVSTLEITIGNTKLQHMKKHTFHGMRQQAEYITHEQLQAI